MSAKSIAQATANSRKEQAENRRRLRTILPNAWDVLTSHDQDLRRQAAHNDKTKAQIADLTNVLTALQRQIETLADTNVPRITARLNALEVADTSTITKKETADSVAD